MKKKFIALTVLFVMLVAAVLTGCRASGLGSTPSASVLPQTSPSTTAPTTAPTTTAPTTTAPAATQPDQNVAAVQTLASTMYFSVIIVEDLSIESQFEGELDLTVTEYTDGSVSLECTLPLSDDFWFDFTHSGNSFTVQHEELGLPYYCAKAYIYQPGLEGYMPYDFAVDLDMEYMIFKQSSNIMSYYVVASSDPEVDPLQIAEHFAAFFRIYDYSDSNEETVTNFYYDLFGTWLSENGEVLGEMAFYITGTLPNAYADGDEVEMELNFIWPESFGYRNEGSMTYTGIVDIFEKHHGHPNFHGTGTLCDPETNEELTFVYNIFPYDSTVIIYLNGQYLINNPPHDKSQVGSKLNYYKEFIFTTP